MALTIRLANRLQTETIDLLDVFKVQHSRYVEGELRDNGRNVLTAVDTLTLFSNAGRTAIREEMAIVEKFLREAILWHPDKVRQDSKWIELNTKGEGPRRGVVYGYSATRPGNAVVNLFMENDALRVVMAVERGEWENTNPRPIREGSWYGFRTVPTYGDDDKNEGLLSNAVDVIGGAIILEAEGTRNGRFKKITLTHNGATDITHLWLGIKPARGNSNIIDGTTTFDPLWLCEDGTLGTDAALVAGGSPALGTNVVEIDFDTDTTLVSRLNLAVEQIAGSQFTDFIGEYLLVLRYRATGTTTTYGAVVVPTMAAGVEAANNNTEVFFDSTSNSLLNVVIGSVTIPPAAFRGDMLDRDVQKAGFAIHIEQIAGTADLQLDAVLLVPQTHSIEIDDINITGAGLFATITIDEGGEAVVMTRNATTILDTPQIVSIKDFTMPVDGGLFLVYGEGGAGAFVASTVVKVRIEVVNRWESYRDD